MIAVGGRPTALECPGGELAITSDDLFMRVSQSTIRYNHIELLQIITCIDFEELMLWSVLYCTVFSFFLFSSLFIYCAGFLPIPSDIMLLT